MKTVLLPLLLLALVFPCVSAAETAAVSSEPAPASLQLEAGLLAGGCGGSAASSSLRLEISSQAECLGPCFGRLCPERMNCVNLGCSDGCCWYECW